MNLYLNINFNTSDFDKWLCYISNTVALNIEPETNITLSFNGISDIDVITPEHIVSLACLIEHLDKQGCGIELENIDGNVVAKYLCEVLHFSEYWAGGKNYVPAQDRVISNLWRITDSEKEIHSCRIHDYLKQNFFRQKDLSAVKNSLDEAYYNIFDHAQANGNAFSFVYFDNKLEKLHVAVCDLGIGIAKLVRENIKEIKSDEEALKKALEYNFTTGSQRHNKGMGLGNIKDTCTENDFLVIVSNRGKLISKSNNLETANNNFNFPGSLIYYELSLNHFDDEEIIDNFVL